jgi:hypothetical protein
MNRIRALLLFAAALVLAPACATSSHDAPHRYGLDSSSPQSVWFTGMPTLVGVANSTTTLFDTTRGGTVTGNYRYVERILVAGQCDQTITVTYQVQYPQSATWVSAAGSVASTTFTASTTNIMESVAMGQELRIQAVTTTAPTVCKLGIKLLYTSPKAN